LGELYCVEYDVIEKYYKQPVESRGIDAGHQIVQVLADFFKPKIGKSGKDRACPRRRTSGRPIRARSRRFESKPKLFEAGQRGEGSEHHLGRNIPGMGNTDKAKIDEVGGRRK
jgi:hypothetical protein